MIKHKEQRVGILVDVSNMYHSAKNLYNKKTNFKEILVKAVAGRKLIRATAYAIRTENKEEAPFIEPRLAQVFLPGKRASETWAMQNKPKLYILKIILIFES